MTSTNKQQSVFDQYQKKPQRGLSAHSTYHPGGYGVSEGLKRARRPFVVRNVLVGGTLAVTAVNLYLYSIYKVSSLSTKQNSSSCKQGINNNNSSNLLPPFLFLLLLDQTRRFQ